MDYPDLNDLQAVGNYVVLNLRKQGKQSNDPKLDGMCLYRGPGGLKCAAGWVLPDPYYRTDLEGTLAPSAFKEAGIAIPVETLGLLCDLQNAHDQLTSHLKAEQAKLGWLQTFENEAREVFLAYELEYPE